ncbi:hypothetical protein CAF53_26375 [Sphingobium sp. LB126]|nr:hypothetical protein CAF53_26375 [Sphingobium sp. LB126]
MSISAASPVRGKRTEKFYAKRVTSRWTVSEHAKDLLAWNSLSREVELLCFLVPLRLMSMIWAGCGTIDAAKLVKEE